MAFHRDEKMAMSCLAKLEECDNVLQMVGFLPLKEFVFGRRNGDRIKTTFVEKEGSEEIHVTLTFGEGVMFSRYPKRKKIHDVLSRVALSYDTIARLIEESENEDMGKDAQKEQPVDSAIKTISATMSMWALTPVGECAAQLCLENVKGEITPINISEGCAAVVNILKKDSASFDHGDVSFPVFKDDFHKYFVPKLQNAVGDRIKRYEEISPTGVEKGTGFRVYVGDCLELKDDESVYRNMKDKISPRSYRNLLACIASMYYGISFSSMQKFVYMKGSGSDGKSSLCFAMKYVFACPRGSKNIREILTAKPEERSEGSYSKGMSLPSNVKSLTIDNNGGRFSLGSAYEANIVHYDEVELSESRMNEIKKLVGGDAIVMEKKAQQAESKCFLGFVISCSNHEIPAHYRSRSRKAEARRICPIIFTHSHTGKPDNEYPARLARSMGFFVEEALGEVRKFLNTSPGSSVSDAVSDMWCSLHDDDEMMAEALQYKLFTDAGGRTTGFHAINVRDSLDKTLKECCVAKESIKAVTKTLLREMTYSVTEAASKSEIETDNLSVSADDALRAAGYRFREKYRNSPDHFLLVQRANELRQSSSRSAKTVAKILENKTIFFGSEDVSDKKLSDIIEPMWNIFDDFDEFALDEEEDDFVL